MVYKVKESLPLAGLQRYKSLIREQEIKGERFISYIRLILSLIFPLLVLLVVVNNNFQVSFGNVLVFSATFLGIIYSASLFYFLNEKRYHGAIRFISPIIESILISAVIFAGSYELHASKASMFIVSGYGVYFVFTTLSVLRFSFAASVFSGFIAMVGYLVIVFWALISGVFSQIFTSTFAGQLHEVRFAVDNEGIKALLLLFSGLIAGYGSLRHKRLLLNSVRQNMAVHRMNRTLEHTVQKRTRELRLRQEEFEKDLDLAREIQSHLLPQNTNKQLPVECSYVYLPFFKVGGDFFDVRRIDEHRFGVFICDVSGHGIGSALIASMVRSIFEQNVTFFDNPAGMLRHLNMSLVQRIPGSFLTAFYAIFNLRVQSLSYANAGHPPPYLINQEGQVKTLKAKGGCIGFRKEIEYFSETVPYTKGERLFVFTDGITEARRPNKGELFGENRLLEFLIAARGLPQHEMLLQLLSQISEFSNYEPLDDDLTAIVIDVGAAGSLNAITEDDLSLVIRKNSTK